MRKKLSKFLTKKGEGDSSFEGKKVFRSLNEEEDLFDGVHHHLERKPPALETKVIRGVFRN